MPGPLKNTDRAADVRWEAEHKFSPEDAEAAKAVLKANAGKNFVQRITNASDWPVMENPDGSYSSHRMANAQVDGKNIAFPTLVYDKDTNALRAPSDPTGEAMRTGEYAEFPTPGAAERFAEGAYKAGMDTGLMQRMLRPEVVNKLWR